MDYSQLQKLQDELDQKDKASKTASLKDSGEKSQKAKIHPPLPEQKIKKSNERKIERHSFDIFSDQKMGLDELQLMLYRKHGKKPKIGSLVREAVDDLFKKYKNERKNE